jgi:hypothetical protein
MYNRTIDFFNNLNLEFNFLELILGILITLVIIYFFRPNIKLGNAKIRDNKIKIQIINKSYWFDATNIIIELALIKNNKKTFDLKLDTNSFILIPNKRLKAINSRIFQVIDFNDATKALLNNTPLFNQFLSDLPEDIQLRIRLHASHELTNFGKSFEFNYFYNNGHFIKEKYVKGKQ